jgi:hypothetical protein
MWQIFSHKFRDLRALGPQNGFLLVKKESQSASWKCERHSAINSEIWELWALRMASIWLKKESKSQLKMWKTLSHKFRELRALGPQNGLLLAKKESKSQLKIWKTLSHKFRDLRALGPQAGLLLAKKESKSQLKMWHLAINSEIWELWALRMASFWLKKRVKEPVENVKDTQP